MKLSELRPCGHCGGPLPPTWYFVRISQCMLNGSATNEVLGLARMLGSETLAEAMAARPEKAVVVFGENIPSMWTEIFLCQSCALGMNEDAPDYNLGELIEKAMERKEENSNDGS